MKKLFLICLCISLLSACGADYSYSLPEYSLPESSLPESSLPEGNFEASKEAFVLEEASLLSPYYLSLGEEGLRKLSEDAGILCLRGMYGTLLYANTPTRMIFNYETEEYVWQLMEYDKLTGEFAPACHDVMCSHEDCLFSQGNKVFAGEYHLFFQADTGDGGYYMSDLDGSDPQALPLPADAFLHAETEEGFYWEKTELQDEKVFYSLWFYSFSDGESRQAAPPAENVIYHVGKEGVYLHELATLTLYRLDPHGGEKKKVTEGITALSCFGGDLYDYDYETGTFRKLVGDEMFPVAHGEGVFDYWVSEGYLYYFCEDLPYMEQMKEDRELYQYLLRDNPTCGSVYRIREGEDSPQLLCRILHDGKPALIDHLFADGEVVYIQCRDYKSFPNRYNDRRGDRTLVILDAQSGEFLEIPN